MTIATVEPEPIAEPAEVQPAETPGFFRLHAIMRQGTAASIPAVWERYSTLEVVRAAVSCDVLQRSRPARDDCHWGCAATLRRVG